MTAIDRKISMSGGMNLLFNCIWYERLRNCMSVKKKKQKKNKKKEQKMTKERFVIEKKFIYSIYVERRSRDHPVRIILL